jgi:TolB-like protein/DNA-binding winged helix-turn-helix (wHTH) protein/Flp pilus assembly protein TadD
LLDSADLQRTLRFQQFEMNLRTGEIYKEGKRLKLQEQPSQVLALLVEHRGEVVTREELRKKLWPNDAFVDFDHGVNIAINKLRDALGDSPQNPRFIETLPRKGYRFIAAVENGSSAPHQDLANHAEPAAEHSNKFATIRRSVKLWIASGLLAATLALFVGLNIGGLRQGFLRADGARRVQSVAVLPLQNLSGDSAQEYFADGMTDALITDLSKIRELRVISRTSVMRYKGTNKSLPEIARELGVEALIEGSVVREGHRVAVTANLIDASTEKHIWSERFNRDLVDILVVQSDFAQAIAHEVQAKLTPSDRARLETRRMVNVDAYDLYLKGGSLLAGTDEDRKRAISYFEQAIEIDPKDPLIYAGVGLAYGPLGYYGYVSPVESDSKMVWAATKALELDESLAEAHATLGLARSVHEWDWSTGEREFRRAIDLNPGYADAHGLLAQILMMRGQTEEALAESSQAAELDPLSPGIYASWGQRLVWARQYDEAIEKCQKALQWDPGSPRLHMCLGMAYELKREYGKAVAELEQARSRSAGSPYYVRSLGHAYAVSGREGQTQQVLTELKEASKSRYVSPFCFALIYTGLGDKEQAFKWFETAYQQRDPALSTIRADPRFDPVRSDPRFQDLLRRVRLEP